MKKNILIIAIFLTTTFQISADEAQAVVDKFFKLTKVKEKYEKGMLAGFDMSAGFADYSSLPKEQQKKIENMQKKVKDLLLEEMGWDKVKDEYTEIYLEVYTVEELKAINLVIQEPIMQKMFENEIKLLPKAMEVGQDKMQNLMPKIIQLSQEAML